MSVRECFDVAGPVPVVGARTESKGLVFTPVIIQANGEEIVGEQMSLENSEQNIPLPENAEVAKVVLHIHRNEGGVSGTTQVRVLKHNQNEEATCFEMKFDANPSTEGCKEVFELACCN